MPLLCLFVHLQVFFGHIDESNLWKFLSLDLYEFFHYLLDSLLQEECPILISTHVIQKSEHPVLLKIDSALVK